MQYQNELLNRVASLIDRGILKTTLTEYLGVLSSASLVKAHQLLAAGKAIGKVVLSGID